MLLLWHQGSAPTRAITPLRAGLTEIDGGIKGITAWGAEGALVSTSGYVAMTAA